MKKTKHRADLVIAIAFVEDFVSPFQSILVFCFFFFSSPCFGLIPQAFSDSSLCPPEGGTYIIFSPIVWFKSFICFIDPSSMSFCN